MSRHHRDAILAKERIDAGTITTPLTCWNLLGQANIVYWTRRFPTPQNTVNRWGGPDPDDDDRLAHDLWSDISVHYLNLMQWWFGPLEAVFAYYHKTGLMMMLRYKSGVLATHAIGATRLSERREYTIFGSEGVIEVRLHYPFKQNSIGVFAESDVQEGARTEILGERPDMYLNELPAFAEAIPAGRTGDPDGLFSSGLHDIMTVKAAYRSAKSGREESVGE